MHFQKVLWQHGGDQIQGYLHFPCKGLLQKLRAASGVQLDLFVCLPSLLEAYGFEPSQILTRQHVQTMQVKSLHHDSQFFQTYQAQAFCIHRM